ncbi:MAG TPA: hypothetical protein VM600_09900, partial [Actinomycetota bacterium]|nr:hypothetical protein [Actinomycetota bacterium]
MLLLGDMNSHRIRVVPLMGLISFILVRAEVAVAADGRAHGVLDDPVVAFLLLFAGLVLIGAEILAPGGVSGVVGALAVVGSFFMLARMPANAGGIALIIAGVALMVLEPLLGGIGVFGIAGA